MALRATRQYVDALQTGAGKLRASRQYVDVLTDFYQIIERSLTSDLNLTDDAHIVERHEYVDTVITFTQRVPAEFIESLTSNLGLTHAATRVHTASLTDPITFVEYLTYIHSVGEHTSLHDTLAFVQDIEFTSGLYSILESEMSMSQDVVVLAPIYRTMWTRMHLYDRMPWENKFERCSQALSLTGWTGRDYEADASTAIALTQLAYWSETPASAMSIVQSLDWGKTKGLPAALLNLGQTVDLKGEWARTITDALGLGHALTYHVPNPCDYKAYSPFIGESTITSDPTPPDNDVPFVQGLPAGERFLLMHPATGESTDIVELRAPNLDNRERQAFTRINRETRGGRLTIFADPTWPKINTLVLSFSGLTKVEVEEVQQFILEHLGEEVGIIDWEGHQWIGIITTPNERAVQDGRSRFTLTFEFEGVMLEETPSGNAMELADNFTHYFHKERSLSDPISFIHFQQYWATFPRSLSDTLSMVDEVDETVESP